MDNREQEININTISKGNIKYNGKNKFVLESWTLSRADAI